MTCYSVQLKDQILLKCYGFLSFSKNIGKEVGKDIKKTQVVNGARNFLIKLNNLLRMNLKLLQN